LTAVPTTVPTKCPNCGFEEVTTWNDPSTSKRLQERELGLQEGSSDARLEALEKRVALLESQQKLEAKQREVVELKQGEAERWAKKREQDFIDIERIAQELRDEEKMRKDGV
jgi:hypothetical protein